MKIKEGGVMDIQKERELFLAHMRSIGLARFMFELDEDGNFDDMSMAYAWSAWQAAKAQSVPEGFVLVPREMPESFDNGLYAYSNNISIVDSNSDGFIPMSDINHAEVWKLVVEAQEPAND